MQTDTPKIVHRIAPVCQISACVGILIALFGMLSMSWIVVESLLDGIRALEVFSIAISLLGMFLCGFCVYIFMAWLKIYAVTSRLGFEYHGIGIHIHASWENTAQITLVGIAARLGIGAEVIELSETPQILSSNRLGRLLFRYQKGISLLEFGKWRFSLLGSEIRKYAPKLLT